MARPETGVEPAIAGLIRDLDAAVGEDADMERITSSVERVLVATDGVVDALPERFLRSDPAKYARRLLHHDPAGRFAVVVMVWGTGQGTPIHDHGGKWCVESVVRGRIRVRQYDLVGKPDDAIVDFNPQGEVLAGVGQAGALIPPFDYHTIENPHDETAVTVHVYGGEMDDCSVFHPENGRYRRERKGLTYTD